MAESGLSSSHNVVYFFYDSEGSGGSAIRDHMIEVAAVVGTGNLGLQPEDEERLGSECYSSLCQCSGEIQAEVREKHGIDTAALADQPKVHTVLSQLFTWIASRVREVERIKREQCGAVLVSHGGNAFDFPLLVTEVERSDCEDSFRRLKLQFADTHALCEQLRSSSDPVLQGSRKLALSELHSLFFPAEEYRTHRARNDALALRKIFTETPLCGHMHRLECISTDSLITKWHSYVDCQQLTVKLGLHKQKAKNLIQRGVTLQCLEREFRERGGSEQWLRGHLRSLGVRRLGDICLQHFRQIL